MKAKDKETFDGLLKVAEFNIKRFDERRGHSWKIALAFWAAIVGSGTLLVDLEERPPICAQAIMGMAFLALHSYWLFRVFHADKKDKSLAFKARDIAIALLDTELEPPPFDIEKAVVTMDWSVQFQFLTSLVLIVAVILLVSS